MGDFHAPLLWNIFGEFYKILDMFMGMSYTLHPKSVIEGENVENSGQEAD